MWEGRSLEMAPGIASADLSSVERNRIAEVHLALAEPKKRYECREARDYAGRKNDGTGSRVD
jgi:hypothetical protein